MVHFNERVKNGKPPKATEPKAIIEQGVPEQSAAQQIVEKPKAVPPKLEIKHKLACSHPDDPNYHIHCPTCNKIVCADRYDNNEGPFPVYGCLVCDILLKPVSKAQTS